MFVAPFAAPFPSPVASSGAATVPWYLAGGVASANCKAAYQPIGAASLAASYSNLANPGTNDAAPGTAPTWASATGWTFNGTTQYLTTGGLVPGSGWSYLCRFSDVAAGTVLFGSVAAGKYHGVELFGTTTEYLNGGFLDVSPKMTAGVVGVAGQTGYRDGVADAGTIPSASAGSVEMYIGGMNNSGSAAFRLACKVQALAIYNTTLTAAQVLAISNAAAALTG